MCEIQWRSEDGGSRARVAARGRRTLDVKMEETQRVQRAHSGQAVARDQRSVELGVDASAAHLVVQIAAEAQRHRETDAARLLVHAQDSEQIR